MATRPSRATGTVLSIGIVLLLCISAASIGANSPGHGPMAATPRADARLLNCGSGEECPTTSARAAGSVLDDLTAVSTQVQVLAGLPFNVTAVPPSGITLTSVNWEFGDGASLSGQSGLTATHVYASPGLDYVSVSATDSVATVHDNLYDLLPVVVLSSHVGDAYGLAPDLLGEIVSNSSGLPNPTAFLRPGGSVTVAVVALDLPRTAGAVATASGFVGPSPSSGDSSLSGEVLAPGGTSQVTVAFTGAQPTGLTTLTYWQETSLPFNGSTLHAWTNYTFSIPVGMGGSPAPREASPNPTSLTVDANGLPFSFDPGIDYETAGISAFQNVYQTLIAANGTQTGVAPSDFVPEVATCVPGSTLCTSLYGTSLTDGTNFTFVISNSTQFFDPATSTGWGVYPSDVVFSVARTLAFSTLPCVECNNGWILAQSLLSPGNGSWDGFHGGFNNTPAPVFASMTVNGSDCPSSALTNEHGCVTFHADADGRLWPQFLALIADPLGGSIVPCGWFSAPAQGAGIPYWSEGNVSGTGDAPCPMPGIGGFGAAPATMPDTGWDPYEVAGTSYTGIGSVYASMAGSGPYYALAIAPSISYTLQANPAYAANPDCTFAGCQPAAGTYIPTVTVDSTQVQASDPDALANGSVDFVAPPQNGTTTLPTVLDAGLAGVRSDPLLSINFASLNLEYDASVATGITGLTYSAPSTLLADPNLRQFLVDSFPNAQIQSAIYTAQGIQYRFPQGGAIPNFLDGATPTNVSWPYGNPDSNPSDIGSAGYWWSLAAADSYTGLNCSVAVPCTFPVAYTAGDTTTESALELWNSTVRTISGGAIAPLISPVPFITLIINTLYSGPGNNPFALYPLGWVDDYADPTDSVTPTYVPDTTYTAGDAVNEVLSTPAYTAGSCSDYVTHYSGAPTPMPIDCQGSAYSAMTQAITQAAVLPDGPARDLLYNEIEQVAQRLGLYASLGQSDIVSAFAPWIDPQSIVVNPAIGTIPWYEVRDLSGPATPLDVRGPTASVNPAPAETPITLSGIATGGTGGYTYSWTGLPNGCASAATPALVCTPTTGGSYTVTLKASDQTGASASGSLALVVGAPSPLSFSSFSAAPNSITLGSPTVVTVDTLGGYAPLAYTYTGLPTGCVTRDLASFSCTPSEAGSFTLHVLVQDSQSASVQGNTTLNVTAGPVFSVSVAVAPTTTVDVDVVLTLTVDATFGVLPITGELAAPGNCARSFMWTTTRSSTVSCTAPAAAGTYAVNVTLTDSLGNVAQANGSLIVHAAPSISAFGPGTIFDVNESANLSLAYSGGTAPYTIGYTHLPPGCVGGNSTKVACQFTTAGTYSIGVTVTDTFGVFTTGVTKLVVSPTLVLASFTASPNTLSVGQELNLTVTVHGGSAPLTFVYSNLPTGCASSNEAVLPCSPTAEGGYGAQVIVHDAAGASLSGTVNVAVSGPYIPPPPPAGFLSNTTLDEEVLGGLVALAVIAVAAYLIVRRRGAPPREEATEAPAEETPIDEAPGSPDPPT